MGAAPTKPIDSSLRVAAPVMLHIYDVGVSDHVQAINKVLRAYFGTGAFHCGVEVYGSEWSYTSTLRGGTGVFCCRPRTCSGHHFFESLPMGMTDMPEAEVLHLVRLLANRWMGAKYDLLHFNCCHFCDKFTRCLGVGAIPAWITSLADTGAAIAETGKCLDENRRVMVENVTRNVSGCCTSLGIMQAIDCCSCAEPTAGNVGAALPIQRPWQPSPSSPTAATKGGKQRWISDVDGKSTRSVRRSAGQNLRSNSEMPDCRQFMSCATGASSEPPTGNRMIDDRKVGARIPDDQECALWVEHPESDQVEVSLDPGEVSMLPWLGAVAMRP